MTEIKDVFVIAMEAEADAVLRHMADALRFEECGRTVYQGTLRGESAAVVVCGIGKVNAAAGTQYAIDRFAPERIVNLGVAGTIDRTLAVGGVHAVSRCFQCDFDLSELNRTPRGTPDEFATPFFELEDPFVPTGAEGGGSADSVLRRPAGGVGSVVVATGDAFTNRDPDLDFVRGEMGAQLRDMELGAIAHVCRRAGVRCCSLKAVSDMHFPDRPPHVEQYAANLRRAVDALAALFG